MTTARSEGGNTPALDAVRGFCTAGALPLLGLSFDETPCATPVPNTISMSRGRGGAWPRLDVAVVARLHVLDPLDATTSVHMAKLSMSDTSRVGVRLSKEVAEVDVESVAFIVCDAIGLDSGDSASPTSLDGPRARPTSSRRRANV